MKKKQSTIFRQLITHVVLPAVASLIILGLVNYSQINFILNEKNLMKNYLITDEIKNILQIQDAILKIFEVQLDSTLNNHSLTLVNKYFSNTDNISSANLKKIRMEMGMDTLLEDIYIIDTNGIVINTTYEKDLGLNFFNFGEEHKNYLLEIMHGGKFVSERFAIEHSTKRLKKYSYQPSHDGNYIIEIGIYSSSADEIKELIGTRLREIPQKDSSIVDVDLFIGSDDPFSFISGKSLDDSTHKVKLIEAFRTAENQYISNNAQRLEYQYIYMQRQNTTLYQNAVIRIVADRTQEKLLLRKELIKNFFIFIITIAVVIIVIYNRTKIITTPIKHLVESVVRISSGHFKERVPVEGNNEISKLSERFNYMISTIEEYYEELDNKVRQRTHQLQEANEELQVLNEELHTTLELVQAHKEEIEEKKKKIEASIHYAKRIQNAILPSDAYIKRLLPESFILFMPRDIVSGDFYWIAEYESKILFAAVDCTGHGVPGAFMSIVGNNQLNHIINTYQNLNPAQILDHLNKAVVELLDSKDEKNQTTVKDGMDLALCMIDNRKKILQYAGAYNPLVLIRNNEIIQVKADKVPIGAGRIDAQQTYNNNVMPILKNDTFYIFSDGYPDQFGGGDNRKFMIKQLKQLLLEVQDKTMTQQKEILQQTIIDWMDTTRQVDDILIAGVRLC